MNSTNTRFAVALITDNSFVMPTCITIVSLLKSKAPGTQYDVYVVTPGLKSKQEKILRSVAVEGCSINIVKGDLDKFANLHKDENSVAYLSASKAAMLKFDLPNLFPNLDKILYLDGDIIIRGDLSELFATDLGEHYLAAAHDTGKMYSKNPMVLKFPGYFNSGMMLLNLRKLREINATEKLMAAKAAMTGKSLMDQPAFNEVCNHHVLHVNSKWNYLAINLDRADEKWNISQLNDMLGTTYADKSAVRKNAVVIHYSSKDKPWKCHVGPWTDLWYKYYKLSPYARKRLPWQHRQPLFKKMFSVRKQGTSRIITLLGISIKYKSRSLKRRAERKALKEKIEALEKEVRVFRNHRNQLVRISNMYRLPAINRDDIASKVENFNSYGLNQEPRDTKLVVSLTSYPGRMYDIHLTLYSLLSQSYKPDKVILWLAEEQFPNGLDDVPKKVKDLQRFGLEIAWCKDWRSFKKLIPALQAYPNAIIVTADDDIYYAENWLQQLVDTQLLTGAPVVAHRCHKLKMEDKKVAPYKTWKKNISSVDTSFSNFFTGAGGVLYMPGAAHPDILNMDKAMALCPHADDIWFWSMCVLAKSRIGIVNPPQELIYVNPQREIGLNNDGVLHSKNSGAGGNDVQLQNILSAYPEILDKLRE